MDAGNLSTLAGAYGNRCGHDPANPRHFSPPARHAARPAILRRIIEAVRRYYDVPRTLPGLNAANESERRQRSERREACCALLGAILHYTDLVTLRVGIPQPDGGMEGLTMPALAGLSGLGGRRADRAVRDLKKAGIITVHPVCKKLDEATYKGLAAIRAVSRNLFEALGLARWLEHERRRAKERRDKKQEKARRKAAANVLMAMQRQTGLEDKLRKAQEQAAERVAESEGPVSAAAFAIATMKAILAEPPPHPPPKPTG